MEEVNRYVVNCNRLWKGGKVLTEVDVSVVLSADYDELLEDCEAWKETASTFEDFYHKTESKYDHLKQLLRNVRTTLHFSPEDVLAIDAALREDEK